MRLPSPKLRPFAAISEPNFLTIILHWLVISSEHIRHYLILHRFHLVHGDLHLLNFYRCAGSTQNYKVFINRKLFAISQNMVAIYALRVFDDLISELLPPLVSFRSFDLYDFNAPCWYWSPKLNAIILTILGKLVARDELYLSALVHWVDILLALRFLIIFWRQVQPFGHFHRLKLWWHGNRLIFVLINFQVFNLVGIWVRGFLKLVLGEAAVCEERFVHLLE